jgi:Lipase (class 2)
MQRSGVARIRLVRLVIALAIIGLSLSLPARTACGNPRVLPVLLVPGYDASGGPKSDWVSGGWIAGDLREVRHGRGWTVYASAAPATAQESSAVVFGTGPVYSLDYSGYFGAKGRLRPSAGLLSKALDVVTADSGAADVYVIAHSQGGLMTRAVMEGLAVDPDDGSPVPYKNNIFGFMTIDTPHKGSSTNWLMRFLSGASKDMVSGSGFLKELNAVPASIGSGTIVSVSVGNAMGDARGDGLFSVDEQTPVTGTVPSSTIVRSFPVVHGRGIIGVDYSRYTAAQDSPQVRGWASVRYFQALRLYQVSSRGPVEPSGTVRPIGLPDSGFELVATYVIACLAWGLAFWLGHMNGRAGVRRRTAWARALTVFLLLGVGSGVWDVSAILVSSLVLPCSYLLGWWMARLRPVSTAKNV